MRDRFTRSTRGYEYRLPEPRQFGDRQLDFSGQLAARIPDLGVHTIHHGTVVAPGWVFDRHGVLVPSTSWHGETDPGPGVVSGTHELGGTAITLGTTWGNLYGHIVTDGLARLGLLSSRHIRRADRILIPDTSQAQEARLLVDRMGIGAKVVEMETGYAYKVDLLYAPTYPGLRRQYDRVVADTLRGVMPEAVGSRRLFVTRRGYRRNLIQADEVESLASSMGYEIYDPMLSDDQALDFRSAVTVAGGSGTGLHNVAYMRPGSRVFEIMSSAHQYAYHATTAAAGGIDYGYTIGDSPDAQRVTGPSEADFSVDLDAVAAGLGWAAQVNFSKTIVA